MPRKEPRGCTTGSHPHHVPAGTGQRSPPHAAAGRGSDPRRAGGGRRGEAEAAAILSQVSAASAGPRRGPPQPPLPSAGGTGRATAGQSPSAGHTPAPPAARLPRERRGPPPPGQLPAGAGAAADGRGGPPTSRARLRPPRRGLTLADSSSGSSRQGRGRGSSSRLMVAESAPRCALGRSARRRLPRRHGRAARPAPPGVPPLRRPHRRRQRRLSLPPLPLALPDWKGGWLEPPRGKP